MVFRVGLTVMLLNCTVQCLVRGRLKGLLPLFSNVVWCLLPAGDAADMDVEVCWPNGLN